MPREPFRRVDWNIRLFARLTHGLAQRRGQCLVQSAAFLALLAAFEASDTASFGRPMAAAPRS